MYNYHAMSLTVCLRHAHALSAVELQGYLPLVLGISIAGRGDYHVKGRKVWVEMANLLEMCFGST